MNKNIINGVVASLPFVGQWMVGATPAERIPSHGTDMFGVGYALDFIAVNDKGRTSFKTDWRTFLSSEKPENFYAFGQPVLSPVSGRVVKVHNGEIDHNAYRSLFTLIPYMINQKDRIKESVEAIAGNYVIIKVDSSEYFVAIVHLQQDSIVVKDNQVVSVGEVIAKCGNSGNSTQPHIHIQAMTSLDFTSTRGVPLYFEKYLQTRNKENYQEFEGASFPEKGMIVEPMRKK